MPTTLVWRRALDAAIVDLYGFGRLLLALLLPWQRRRIVPQLRTVLQQQISHYRQLTGLRHIRLDRHQHIHLVLLVLDLVREEWASAQQL